MTASIFPAWPLACICSRRPCTVVAIAVGWWAKSSSTCTPLTSPRSCMRRFTPLNRESASMAFSNGTPKATAALMAACALVRLWAPMRAWLFGRWAAAPLPRLAVTSKLFASLRGPEGPVAICAGVLKYSTGVYTPRAITRASASSWAFTISRPCDGRVRIQ